MPELLSTHPFFATPEPSIDDPAYVAILILVFNATAKSPTMLTMFPDHTTRHYGYLRDSQSQLVPHLDIEQGDSNMDHNTTEGKGDETSKWNLIYLRINTLVVRPTVQQSCSHNTQTRKYMYLLVCYFLNIFSSSVC